MVLRETCAILLIMEHFKSNRSKLSKMYSKRSAYLMLLKISENLTLSGPGFPEHPKAEGG